MGLFKNLFGGYKTKYKTISEQMFKCLSENEALVFENNQLRTELDKKQEQINKTNSYWKGVVRELKSKKPARKRKDTNL